MPNGEGVWNDIKEVRKDITNLAKDGCGHRVWHDKGLEELRQGLIFERKDREHLGEFILKELKDTKEAILADTRTVRNQLLFGMLILMALTLVIDKVLK
jgi:hypothetical protein